MVKLLFSFLFPLAAKNLIGQLLTVDPAYRLTASEIPCHPWMSGKKISANYQRQTNVLDMMKDFNSKNYDDDGDEEEEEDSAADESVDADNSNSVQQDVKSEKVVSSKCAKLLMSVVHHSFKWLKANVICRQ